MSTSFLANSSQERNSPIQDLCFLACQFVFPRQVWCPLILAPQAVLYVATNGGLAKAILGVGMAPLDLNALVARLAKLQAPKVPWCLLVVCCCQEGSLYRNSIFFPTLNRKTDQRKIPANMIAIALTPPKNLKESLFLEPHVWSMIFNINIYIEELLGSLLDAVLLRLLWLPWFWLTSLATCLASLRCRGPKWGMHSDRWLDIDHPGVA